MNETTQQFHSIQFKNVFFINLLANKIIKIIAEF